MMETKAFSFSEHTLVCNDTEVRAAQDAHSVALLALIQHHIDRDPRSLGEMAKALKISRRQLGRILGGRKPLRLADLKLLSDVLGIDRARAIIAIDVIGDWQSYDDPHLCIVMRLLAPVVSKLNERAEFSIEPLTVAAETRLADWLANLIITNEEQIRHRRNEFVKLPSL